MYEIQAHPSFPTWLARQDSLVRARLTGRILKLTNGLFGDHRSVGEGVHELRENFGKGWRIYYVRRGQVLIIILAGGSKATQQADIQRAKALASLY